MSYLSIKLAACPYNISLRSFADTTYFGICFKAFAETYFSTTKSRDDMVPTYAPFPVIRTSKLQTYVTTTTNILEYLPFYTDPYCKVSDDNTGALEIARLPKTQTHTKAIDVAPHNFQEYVRLGLISVCPISTYNQLADIVTNPLTHITFIRICVQWRFLAISTQRLRGSVG